MFTCMTGGEWASIHGCRCICQGLPSDKLYLFAHRQSLCTHVHHMCLWVFMCEHKCENLSVRSRVLCTVSEHMGKQRCACTQVYMYACHLRESAFGLSDSGSMAPVNING